MKGWLLWNPWALKCVAFARLSRENMRPYHPNEQSRAEWEVNFSFFDCECFMSHIVNYFVLILSSSSSLNWHLQSRTVIPLRTRTLCVYCTHILLKPLYTFALYLCVPACHGAVMATCTHTHMGLVKPCSNPERLESRGRSLGLGPLQLATGSHDSNKRVASQLQGTVMLFSPKEPDWRKMNNYGLRDWMNDYSSAVF